MNKKKNLIKNKKSLRNYYKFNQNLEKKIIKNNN